MGEFANPSIWYQNYEIGWGMLFKSTFFIISGLKLSQFFFFFVVFFFLWSIFFFSPLFRMLADDDDGG